MEEEVQEILLTEQQIQAKVNELGLRLSRDYAALNPLVICVLKGASLFMADLIRHMNIPLELDFIAISSYGISSKSSGIVRIVKDLDCPVEGRHLLVIEDVVDTGLTLAYLLDLLRRRNAVSVKVCVLLNKPSRRIIDLKPDYLGFTIPDAFVVGYGLDYAERYRNLPYIGILKPKISASD